MTERVTLPLRSVGGEIVGDFTVICLRGRERWRDLDTLIELDPIDASPGAPVQVLEELSYGYTVSSERHGSIERLEPSELFSSTSDAGDGRLDVQRSTGTLSIEVRFENGTTGQCELEVRSRKLNYQTEYRSMLLRIAREAAELVQAHFAPSSLPAFRPEMLHDPETLYQRFAFIKALLESPTVEVALHLVQRRPHFEHASIDRTVDPARSSKAGPSLCRQLIAAGPRQPAGRPVAGLLSLPRSVTEVSHETTYDTVPNRFVKYVLTRWRDIAADVQRALSGAAASDHRGRREAQLVVEELERALSTAPLADAGRLTSFPHSNQVLQNRIGYREILESFLLAEAAATINWDERERLFSAGQRNVAELYEYWAFLELVRIVECVPGFVVNRRDLVRRTKNGLSLELRKDGRVVVSARGKRRGTTVRVDVWFNKTFSGPGPTASWTVPLRPDCSIQITPENRVLDADTWIHFDAKYRISELSESLEDLTEEIDTPIPPSDQRPVSSDLTKMHTYRDAIRRTAGAYVLYPGRDGANAVRHTQYHEILPGLGAFNLRPDDDGIASESSSSALVAFLDDVIDHVAAQGTAAERSRYWTTRSYTTGQSVALDFSSLLTKPPSDTSVLLGFVRSAAHLEWILATSRYNLRADISRLGSVGVEAPELSPDFILLYDDHSANATLARATGYVSVQSGDDLQRLGYPNPSGQRYFCLDIDVVGNLSGTVAAEARRLAKDARPTDLWSAPRLVNWSDLGPRIRVQ